MGLLDKILGKKEPKPPVDFSDVRSGSSSTAPPPAPAPPPSPSTPAAAPRIYTVVSGDSLSRIAKREYGDGNKWPIIFEANRDKIKNPDLIHPGQVLNIPALADGGR